MSRPLRNYEKQEPCLCFHGAYLYEAKILDYRQEDPEIRKSPWEYRVHYKGWKNTWDDWVTDDRLRKATDENKELAANLYKELRNQQREERDQKAAAKKGSHASAKRKSEAYRTSEERSSSVQASARGMKRGRDWEIEREDAFSAKPSIRIPLPDHIKGLLVDDWENVTKSLLLVPLPHKYTVVEVLADYQAQESQNRRPESAESDILEEIVQGLREYFDKSLGRVLLYRYERQQWVDLLHRIKAEESIEGGEDNDEVSLTGKKPSEVYGVEHLCRLFVSMPELIAQTNMDAPSINRLREELHKLTKWLGKNTDRYWMKEYYDPGSSYKHASKYVLA